MACSAHDTPMHRPAESRHRQLVSHPRRGSMLLLVIWTISVATLIVMSLQMSAYRQAVSGREAMGRVRARWAARAGVESVIAYLAWEAENAATTNPLQIQHDLEESAEGELFGASYRIQHSYNGEILAGPADAHARINLHLLEPEQWLLMDDMDEDLLAGIQDWVDGDENPRLGGAEAAFYQTMPYPYLPRNGNIPSLQELEMVYLVEPGFVRGEDWNLNGMLDPNEDDGDLSWPPDNADGTLNGGWSDLLTAVSRGGGLGLAGESRLDLAEADILDITRRLDVDRLQAQALAAYAQAGTGDLAQLLVTPLSGITEEGAVGGGETLQAADLDDDQFRQLFAETAIGVTSVPVPGKVNINTASREVLALLPGFDEDLADEVEFGRNKLPRGYESLLDLLELDLELITPQTIVDLMPYIDVRSNVFVITSRGLARPGDTQVEMVVTVDRTTLPVRIIEYLER